MLQHLRTGEKNGLERQEFMDRKVVSKVSSKKKESFSYFAPAAGDVQLLGDFTQWEDKPIALRKLKNGTWKTTVSLAPGLHESRFKVDGEWRDDSDCPMR